MYFMGETVSAATIPTDLKAKFSSSCRIPAKIRVSRKITFQKILQITFQKILPDSIPFMKTMI